MQWTEPAGEILVVREPACARLIGISLAGKIRMLELVVRVLETFLYYRPSRVIAWGLGAAGAASLVLAVVRPSELWFGFVLSPMCFAGCIASIAVGNWFTAYAESRERERSWRERAPQKQAPARGFPVVPPRDRRDAR